MDMQGFDNDATGRSPASQEFESFWKKLPRCGALPGKRDFRPAALGHLLPFVMLAEARLEPAPSLLIRIVGSAIEERIQRDITGQDYFEFLEADRRVAAVQSLRLMLNHPCGLWQIMPYHYVRGIAQKVEGTVFPLLGEPAPYLLGLVIPRDEPVRPISPGPRAMLAGGATSFEFLDVGAGVPPWPPA